jgi:hypothetical protein
MPLHRLSADDPSLTTFSFPNLPFTGLVPPSLWISSSIALYPFHLHEQYAAVFS